MDPLSKRQRAVLESILRCNEEQGRFPSIREIARALDVSSPATVYQHLEALEGKGYLRRRGRHWMLTEWGRRDRGVPIVGRVAAGAPLMAVEQIEGHVDGAFLGLRPGRFAVEVVGDSMVEEGILAGDYVIVDPDRPVAAGDLVVAYLGEDQEVTIKRFFPHPGQVELRPANPRYEPFRIPEGDLFFRVGGKVIGLARRLG